LNVIFRVDASYQIGSGHVMRCLTLADELKMNGHRVIFISRNLNGNLFEPIVEKGYELYPLKGAFEKNPDLLFHSHWLEVSWKTDVLQTIKIIEDLNIIIDWMIIDHYAIDLKWEEVIGDYVGKLLVIDDLADRCHNCDILLDQNYYEYIDVRYNRLISDTTIKLLGPEYSLIRDEFILERKCFTKESKGKSGILIFFGGSDPTQETLKVIQLLKGVYTEREKVHVVVGKNNKQKVEIKDFCNNNPRFIYHYQINYMAMLMRECSLAICAGGSFTWERYCMGLPGILVAVAHNQVEICKGVQNLNIDYYIGLSNHYLTKSIIKFCENIDENKIIINSKQQKAMNLVDGLGKKKVVNFMQKLHN
jgi:UDP-2,4-diacetamido-2,4,6-trideoxy-beta-L-altropyranose hydrolase